MPLNQFFAEGYYVHMRAGWVQKPNSKILLTQSSHLSWFTWKFAYFKNVNRFLFNLSDFNWQEDHLMLMFSARPDDIFKCVERFVICDFYSRTSMSKWWAFPFRRGIPRVTKCLQQHISTHALSGIFLKFFFGNGDTLLALHLLYFHCASP